MSDARTDASLTDAIAAELPFLRRYARALTGSQETGDRYAAATLEAILADDEVFDRSATAKVALFKVFHGIWASSGAPVDSGPDAPDGPESQAQRRLSGLTPNTREALLLHSIENFRPDEIGDILGVGPGEAAELVTIAQNEMADGVTGRVMVIEDEAIIAMDISSIVSEMGHSVTGVATTRDEAVKLGRADPPDLILADIQLADKSSGIDAVNDLLSGANMPPVVFITAFPERLLTGERPEPAFLISKPYNEGQIRSAVSQAMFFASTETLTA